MVFVRWLEWVLLSTCKVLFSVHFTTFMHTWFTMCAHETFYQCHTHLRTCTCKISYQMRPYKPCDHTPSNGPRALIWQKTAENRLKSQPLLNPGSGNRFIYHFSPTHFGTSGWPSLLRGVRDRVNNIYAWPATSSFFV